MYEEAVKWIRKALDTEKFDFVYLPSHKVPAEFPKTEAELNQFDVVILSDVGADSLLLSPETFQKSIRMPNRLKSLKNYVENGGSLCMIGGYLTFQGIDAKGRYHNTEIEEILPVNLSAYDDRKEVPEGFNLELKDTKHPITKDIPKKWPYFLGYNKLELKEDAQLLAEYNGDPIISVREVGRGRTMAFASDCAPHWGSPEFCEWEYYSVFWQQAVNWLSDN
jgi:uncharacterized membrane protein